MAKVILPWNIFLQQGETEKFVSIIKSDMNPIYSMKDMQKLKENILGPFYQSYVQSNPGWKMIEERKFLKFDCYMTPYTFESYIVFRCLDQRFVQDLAQEVSKNIQEETEDREHFENIKVFSIEVKMLDE